MLKGMKTKISAAMICLAGVLFGFGVLDQVGLVTMITIFGGAGLFGMRDAVK